MSLFSKKNAEELAFLHFGIHTTAKSLPSYADLNFLLKTKNSKKFVLKIYNPNEAKEQLETQNKILLHLEKHLPELSFPRIIKNKNGENTTFLKSNKNGQRLARLLTWVEGRMLVNVTPHTPRLLKNFGHAVGHLCNGLQGFDHPAAHRYFEWDVSQAAWTKQSFHFIKNKNKRALAEHFYELFIKNALPKLPALRKSVLHNDANDFNVLVNGNLENPSVSGIIDFGDIVYSATINELAIAIAYAVMRKNDPLTAAAQIVEGAHEIFPLEEKELEILYHLVAARLLISLTSAAINISKNPENEYLKVSQQPGWDLLEKWKAVPAALAHFTFRQACGFEPCPSAVFFREKIAESCNFSLSELIPEAGIPTAATLDLSVGSLDLGNNQNFATAKNFAKTIARMLEGTGAKTGIGGYGEVRPFYTTDAYQTEGNEGPKWRTVHLGLDVWASAATPVLAPLHGTVFSFQNNKGERNYGPTIILKHNIKGLEFFTLYGHLSLSSIAHLTEGQVFKKGKKLAEIGAAPENGNWPPHLHFQTMLNMLGNKGDFPSAAFPEQKETWMSICPDPMLLFGGAEKKG